MKLKTKLPAEDGIMFMDSCHPSMATKLSYSWIKKRQSKPIETTDSWAKINLVSSINLSEFSKPIVCSYTTVDGESIVDFLSQVRKYTAIKGTIHFVLYQAGYHRCLEVIKAAN